MTTIYTRSPLQSLAMNHAPDSNAQRRGVRRGHDDTSVSEPPAKRARKTGSMSATAAQQIPAAPVGRTRVTRARVAAHKEQDDGFAFSRKSKRTAKPTAAAPVVAQPMLDAPGTKPDSPPKQQTPPPKRKSRRTLAATPDFDHISAAKKSTRKSKHISKDDGQMHDEEQATDFRQSSPVPAQSANHTPKRLALNDQPTLHTPAQTAARDTQIVDDDHSPLPSTAADTLHVEKKRNEVKINMLFAETPIIRKNKQIRNIAAAESHRRSSSSLRGHRASSLMESRSSSALLHPTVPSEDFYKHIGQELSEPQRMRTLLIWSGHRALPKRPESISEDDGRVFDNARAASKRLVEDFANRGELSSWFDRPEVPADTAAKQPHPRNVANATRLEELETELERLRAEKKVWDELDTKATKDIAATRAAIENHVVKLDPHAIDHSLLDESQAEILHTLFPTARSHTEDPEPQPEPATDIQQSTQAALDQITNGLEFKLDSFADNMHRLEQYRLTADRFADTILARNAARLEERNRRLQIQAAAANGVKSEDETKPDTLGLLRALSRVGKDTGSQ